ncbi:MAG: methyltransferase domain-containing protein [Thermoanaerobaculia bacterium]|nr:methyltransferase domain-containing protein [Thermoanaerobaculia bacterium]MCZ7652341.1 class I SAM-dependent methyltransferase [Thermoanaerobaculia bacterium]
MASLGYAAGWRLLSRAFAQAPLAVRLHVLGRYATCPFRPLLAELPAGARLLDLGGGHGIFARLALAAGAREAWVVEPDRRKLLPPVTAPGLRQVAARGEALAGGFDVVAVVDVLYRLPFAEWPAFLAGVRERLRPGGLLLLKEIDPEARWKGRWNRAQERLADLCGLTVGEGFSYEPRARVAARLAAAGFSEIRTVDLGRGYPHAHLLYAARRPPAAGASLRGAPSSAPRPPASARPGT